MSYLRLKGKNPTYHLHLARFPIPDDEFGPIGIGMLAVEKHTDIMARYLYRIRIIPISESLNVRQDCPSSSPGMGFACGQGANVQSVSMVSVLSRPADTRKVIELFFKKMKI